MHKLKGEKRIIKLFHFVILDKFHSMQEFPNTKEAAEIILKIIRTAKNRVVLISPYVKPSENFFIEIENASRKGTNILLICRENEIKTDVKKRLTAFNNLEILNNENLHAKCYYNEEILLQTSLNLLDHSEKNNIEIGFTIERNKNEELFYRALAQPEMIVRDSISRANRSNSFQNPPRFNNVGSYNYENLKLTYFKPINGEKGVCIRCKESLSYLDGNFPLCVSDFKVWAIFYNWDFEEKNCHWCGKNYPTTKRKPFCRECFEKYQNYLKKANTSTPPNEPKPQNETQAQTPEIQIKKTVTPEKKNKNLILFSAVLLLTLLIIVLFVISRFNKSNETISSTTTNSRSQLINKIHSYYYDDNANKLNPSIYFAATVNQYFQLKNTTPDEIHRTNINLQNEFRNVNSLSKDSTFSFSKDPFGNDVVELWINYSCFRNSKNKYEQALVHEQFVFDSRCMFISLKELETKNLRYTDTP